SSPCIGASKSLKSGWKTPRTLAKPIRSLRRRKPSRKRRMRSKRPAPQLAVRQTPRESTHTSGRNHLLSDDVQHRLSGDDERPVVAVDDLGIGIHAQQIIERCCKVLRLDRMLIGV